MSSRLLNIFLLLFFSVIICIGGALLFFNKSASVTIFKKLPIINPVTKIYQELDTADTQHKTLLNFFNSHSKEYQLVQREEQADIIVSYNNNPTNTTIYRESLVFFTSNQTITDNLNLSDLQKINLDPVKTLDRQFDKIITLASYKNYLTDNYFSNSESAIEWKNDPQEIKKLVLSNDHYLGLLPVSSLTIDIHPLRLNNISALENPEQYPLSLIISAAAKKSNQLVSLVANLQPYIKTSKITKILAVGDIMMGRFVGVKINRSGNPAHSFEYVSDYLKRADITFTDLEAPFAYDTPLVSDGMILVAQSETVAGLTQSGIDLVTISSNHFGDALRSGMEDNFRILEKNNIPYVGAGRTEQDAFTPKLIEKNGTKFVFISFGSIMPDSYGASDDIAGTAWIDLEKDNDLEKVKKNIRDAKDQGDIVIVCFHWGTEYTPDPTSRQRLYAHQAIDAGADLIVGTHPHVVQANEIYKDKYIIYSLGNFIMDQMWSQETTEGILMPFYVYDKKIIALDLIPTQIIDYSQVKIISKEEGKHILTRIWSAGEKLVE